MPINNLASQHLQPADIAAIDAAITTLENALNTFLHNLTPEERQRYGSVNETNKLFINKVWDYRRTEPGLSSPDVSWTEFGDDLNDRAALETRANRILSLFQDMTSAKILHDYDNYQNALVDYAYTKYKKDTEAGGYLVKYNELRQFFPNTGGGGGTDTPAPTT